MPRKRRASIAMMEIEEVDYAPDEKHGRVADLDNRTPRNTANARERARMRVLSKAFSKLKMTLPMVPADTKLSKLDTLRLAVHYIAYLRQVLLDDGDPHGGSAKSFSLALSWPFALEAANGSLMQNSCRVSSSSTSSLEQLQSPNNNDPMTSMHNYHSNQSYGMHHHYEEDVRHQYSYY